MELLILFMKGAVAGFVIAAPVGPVGLMCVRHSVAYGRLSGMVTGFGAALADAFFGVAAAYGLNLIADWMAAHASPLRFASGVVLLALGLRMLHKPPKPPSVQMPTKLGEGAARGALTAFFLTVTNPITIAAFLAVFAALGIQGGFDASTDKATLVGGVFIGSLLWFSILVAAARWVRRFLDHGGVLKIHRATGVMMILFALYAFLSLNWL